MELSDLYSINKVVTDSSSIKDALDEIIRHLHHSIIFDNFVVYAFDNDLKTMEVIFAKSMGRGRSAEADVTWGENLANQICVNRKLIYQKPEHVDVKDRLKNPHLLGIPMSIGDDLYGVMTFIRYGGPTFTEPDIEGLSFMSNQIAWLLQRETLLKVIEKFEAQNRATQLQEDFINAITHEIRNPLGFIKGYTTTLLRSDAEWNTATQREFLQIIDHETDQLEELIGNLLDSARLQSGQLRMEMQPIRVDTILNDVIQRNQMHHPGIRITLDTPSKIPIINADPWRLAQVFTNLITNAVKYAPNSQIQISVQKVKKWLRITVRDFGPGIPEKYLPYIFDRFFRNPDQPVTIHGTGLGLYICKQIIHSHNGEISVLSKNNEGSIFSIELPIDSTNNEKQQRGKKSTTTR